MNISEIYTKGARIWIPHTSNVWQGARISENFVKSKLQVITDDGEVKELNIATDEDLPPLRNPDILIGENDLTSLSYLHEPAVLYNLQVRFIRQNAIYTYCGIVLVAINPYCDISIYDSDTIWAYRGKAMGDLDPHIFAVAEEAFNKIEREERNQSIIVSGESGAGKTVSAKYAMRYFATVGGSASETQVERKVLASSPIMEAIGNAKTTRNDNSSRFGKYIELHFNRNFTIVGASMSTYLLEKSRVVFQATGERNYHIFYQICAARAQLKNLNLESADSFHYLSDSDSAIQGVNDEAQFDETVSAFTTLGFSKDDIENIFTVLASILHLGNVLISDTGGGDAESCAISPNDTHLLHMTKLLEINGNELRQWLCHRRIASGREVFNKPMTQREAMGARDALSKHIYACLFAWIVTHINRSLNTSVEAKHRFIGVLDIYGFETFDVNSFEQFCINYANEKLQQQFNMHVFKLEQDEYVKEDIEWKFIDFYDNQPCIDLIETKLGILDLLDEECRMPKGSDSSWAEKLYSKCTKWNHFVKPRFGSNAFIVKHFADEVKYEVLGFLEKNRDTVIEEQVTILKSSGNKLIQKLFSDPQEESKLAVPKPRVRISIQPKLAPAPVSSSLSLKNKKTVGSQFRDSLNSLMSTLNSTTPHYIRCIKPNDEKEAFKYNPSRAVQQLRACGVLETIRISAAGFPSRWLYNDFLNRYRALWKSKSIDRKNPKSTCEKMLSQIIQDTDKCKFGRTKIFFRAGQVAYLERLRSEKLLRSCIKIQTAVRGYLVRRHYVKTLTATGTLQRYFRGYLARRRVKGILRNNAAVKIQKWVRRWVKQKQYLRTRKVVMGLQAYGRGLLGRRRYRHLKETEAATKIQTAMRGWLCRKKYRRTLKKIIIIQSTIRRFIARRRFRKMKREAKSAEHLKKLNKGLENKIMSLSQKLQEVEKEMTFQKSIAQEGIELKKQMDAMRGIEIQLKNTKNQLNEKDKTVEELLAQMDRLKEEITKKDIIVNELKRKESTWIQENKQLKADVEKLNGNLNATISQMEVEIKTRLREELSMIEEERKVERSAHQKLLQENQLLEARCDALERSYGKGHKRTSSDASTVSAQEEDVGYASVRSNASSGREETPTPDNQIELLLLSKLQQKIRALESENRQLHSKLHVDRKIVPDRTKNGSFHSEELEIENARLRSDLAGLRDAVTKDATNKSGGGKVVQEMSKKLELWENEAKRLREEVAALRETLGTRTSSTSSLARSSYPTADVNPSVINEDGELVLAFEAQKRTLRQVEDELQEKSIRWEIEREELVGEMNRLRSDSERKDAILAGTVGADPGKSEAYYHSEITRLLSENLDLQERYDLILAKNRKLSEQVNELRKKLKDAGVLDVANTVDRPTLQTQISQVHIRKKERQYMGMFECRLEDVPLVLRHLLELKPKVSITLLPGLPAYILFMLVRYTDYLNDVNMLESLLLGYGTGIKKLMKKKAKDPDTGILWLANTLRLVHTLKQYSGEPNFAKDNTQTQNEQCLKNFDLSEFRQVFCDEAVAICQNILRKMQDIISPIAVGAVLEHEAISGLTSSFRGRSSSVAAPQQQNTKAVMDELLSILSSFKRTLDVHGVDPQLRNQFFVQLFYFICAKSLNVLLLRKEFCHWSKGMQIRFNLSHLEQWVREEKIQEPKVIEMLDPIVQASQLLQARKLDSDVDSVAEMCSKLTPIQIIKLLNLYTPLDSYEEKVSDSFIMKIQEKLKNRTTSKDSSTLMMDAQKTFPLEFPFNPSRIRLEDIEIPEVLNLPMLKKL